MTDKSDFSLSKKLGDILNTQLHRSSWPYKFGNHIEERIGLINFSIIGRDCPQHQRDDYQEWDRHNKEREFICKHIKYMMPELDATISGQISIDIYPKEKE